METNKIVEELDFGEVRNIASGSASDTSDIASDTANIESGKCICIGNENGTLGSKENRHPLF